MLTLCGFLTIFLLSLFGGFSVQAMDRIDEACIWTIQRGSESEQLRTILNRMSKADERTRPRTDVILKTLREEIAQATNPFLIEAAKLLDEGTFELHHFTSLTTLNPDRLYTDTLKGLVESGTIKNVHEFEAMKVSPFESRFLAELNGMGLTNLDLQVIQNRQTLKLNQDLSDDDLKVVELYEILKKTLPKYTTIGEVPGTEANVESFSLSGFRYGSGEVIILKKDRFIRENRIRFTLSDSIELFRRSFSPETDPNAWQQRSVSWENRMLLLYTFLDIHYKFPRHSWYNQMEMRVLDRGVLNLPLLRPLKLTPRDPDSFGGGTTRYIEAQIYGSDITLDDIQEIRFAVSRAKFMAQEFGKHAYEVLRARGIKLVF